MAKAKADIRSTARSHALAAIKVLIEVMSDPSAPSSARVAAATQVLNRGLGSLAPDHVKFIPDNREFYVYSVQSKAGELIYIGKGIGRRSFNSAKRLDGRSRIRAVFNSEKQALAFESRLIRRFNPPQNIMLRSPENRSVSGNG
jgi:hypothetical protein